MTAKDSGGRIHMALRLPPTLHERLRVAADERDVSVNLLITKAIEEFLPRLIPPEELRFTRDTAAPSPAVGVLVNDSEHFPAEHAVLQVRQMVKDARNNDVDPQAHLAANYKSLVQLFGKEAVEAAIRAEVYGE